MFNLLSHWRNADQTYIEVPSVSSECQKTSYKSGEGANKGNCCVNQ